MKYPTGFTIPGDDEARMLLAQARELGINLIDTAPAYGRSEERLGPLLRGQRDEWVIVSKVGEEFDNGLSHFDFSAAHTRRSVERSLRRLETDRIELVLVHSDGNDLAILEQQEVYQTLAELKQEGKILGFGLSGKTVAGGLKALEQGDCAMVTYNLNEQAERPVLDYAAEHGKAILVKKALASGHICLAPGVDPVQASFELLFAHRVSAVLSSAPSIRCTWPTTWPPSPVSWASTELPLAQGPEVRPDARRSLVARTLIRKNPSNFKTLPLHVEATPEGLTYQSIGMPLNFAQTQQRRKAIQLPDTQRFVVELANLGVSVRLTLHWQNRDYWVLVRQRRQDRGDVVLKLISGYVPAQELNLPLHTAVQEVAEECLLETPEGWLGGRFNDTWLPVPYAAALHYRETPHFVLTPQSGAARPVHCSKLMLMERPRAYVHLPTASLQLIYDMRLQVPREAKKLSLFHVDERLEGDQLEARLNRKRPDLYLMPLKDGQPVAELYTLKKKMSWCRRAHAGCIWPRVLPGRKAGW